MVAAASYDATNGAETPISPHKPKAIKLTNVPDFQSKFSDEAHKRTIPAVRELATAFVGIPGIIPMNAGLPPADVFPMTSIQLNLKDNTTITIDQPADVIAAQQYNMTIMGLPKLLQWVKEHTRAVHGPPAGHEIAITAGSNSTLDMIFKAFLNHGESVLVEEFTYCHVPQSMFDPNSIKTVAVKTDQDGIIPSSLSNALAKLEAKGEPIPKLLYTIPVGQNPTGSITSLQRKEQVYALCRRYDILILEDDPYFYLQFQAGQKPRGLQNLVPSYLSMDSDLRVIRLDTFSKVLIPGLRLGWITAHPEAVMKFIYHFHGVAMGPCSMSQVLMAAILEKLGHDGFEAHLKAVQAKYVRRAELIMAAADKHFKGLANWDPVTSGMFLWIRLAGVEDVNTILPDLQAAGVIVVPGTLTMHSFPNLDGAVCNCLRVSFVTAAEEALEEGISRLATVLRRYPLPQKTLA